ncbi:MAG TPA: hypothetical protein VJK54_03980 [Chthoniobacterales bacterium]|nr:hypothetical protein [Chthoniobacterales bacterium]
MPAEESQPYIPGNSINQDSDVLSSNFIDSAFVDDTKNDLDNTLYSGHLVTATLYCMFLNAVAATTDIHHLYDERMSSDRAVASITRSSDLNGPKKYFYSVIEGKENSPIVYVNLFATMRFCNWLEHGHPINVSAGQENPVTEEGSYTFKDDILIENRSLKAQWFLPNIDEWHKTPHYKEQDTRVDIAEWTETLMEEGSSWYAVCEGPRSVGSSDFRSQQGCDPLMNSNQIGFRIVTPAMGQLMALANPLQNTNIQDDWDKLKKGLHSNGWLKPLEDILCQGWVAAAGSALVMALLLFFLTSFFGGITLGVITGVSLAVGSAASAALNDILKKFGVTPSYSWLAAGLGLVTSLIAGTIASAFLLEVVGISSGIIAGGEIVESLAYKVEHALESTIGQECTEGVSDSIERFCSRMSSGFQTTGTTAIERAAQADELALKQAEKVLKQTEEDLQKIELSSGNPRNLSSENNDGIVLKNDDNLLDNNLETTPVLSSDNAPAMVDVEEIETNVDSNTDLRIARFKKMQAEANVNNLLATKGLKEAEFEKEYKRVVELESSKGLDYEQADAKAASAVARARKTERIKTKAEKWKNTRKTTYQTIGGALGISWGGRTGSNLSLPQTTENIKSTLE